MNYKHVLLLLSASTPKRKVIAASRRVVLLTDLPVMNHTELDRHFHTYYNFV